MKSHPEDISHSREGEKDREGGRERGRERKRQRENWFLEQTKSLWVNYWEGQKDTHTQIADGSLC